MRQCLKCKQWKSEKEFRKGKYRHCKECNRNYYYKYGRLAHKKYYQKNKEIMDNYCKSYNIKNKKKNQLVKRRYYQKLKKEGYFERNRDKNNKRALKWQRKNLLSWLNYLPKNPYCEICNKRLKYFCKGNGALVHFDHKNEHLPIKTNPSAWLRSNRLIPKNLEIWKSCNFGVLCIKCNTSIPTKNRKEWLQKIIKYVNSDFK